jgi:hypothetical protein
MNKLCFYYQVWYTNQLSTFEALKQLRLFYPTDEIVLVVAGLKRENSDEYDKNFTQIVKQHFNITKTDYLYVDDHPYMNKSSLRIPDISKTRDEYTKFAHVWLDQFMSLPSDDVEIIFSCSDDWIPFGVIPINFDIDVCGRIVESHEWMNVEELTKYINIDDNKVCWIQHGHYMNLKKLRQVYNDTNKQYIENVIKNLYNPELPMFLDYIYALWNSLTFEKMISADYILEVGIYGSPEDAKSQNYLSSHGSKLLHNQPISQEMINLNIIPSYE